MQVGGVVGVEAGLLRAFDAMDEQVQALLHDELPSARPDEDFEGVFGGRCAIGQQQLGAAEGVAEIFAFEVHPNEGLGEDVDAFFAAGVGVGSLFEQLRQPLRIITIPQKQLGAVMVANGCRQLGVHDAQLPEMLVRHALRDPGNDVHREIGELRQRGLVGGWVGGRAGGRAGGWVGSGSGTSSTGPGGPFLLPGAIDRLTSVLLIVEIGCRPEYYK